MRHAEVDDELSEPRFSTSGTQYAGTEAPALSCRRRIAPMVTSVLLNDSTCGSSVTLAPSPTMSFGSKRMKSL